MGERTNDMVGEVAGLIAEIMTLNAMAVTVPAAISPDEHVNRVLARARTRIPADYILTEEASRDLLAELGWGVIEAIILDDCHERGRHLRAVD